jgi:uncharacterized protein (DUF302 family)
MKPRHEPVSFDLLKADSFIRGESTLAVVCDEPFETVAARLEGSITANGLVILHVHDIRQLLADSGMALDIGCRVYEVFSAPAAASLMAMDPGLAHVLPCRISVHDQGGITTVTTPMPSTLLTEFSHAAAVARLARSLEAAMHRVLRGIR